MRTNARTWIAMLLGWAAVGTAWGATCEWQWANPNPPRTDVYRLKVVSNTFVGVGRAGTVVRSSDGYSWELVPSGVAGDLFGIDWGAGSFVAVGDGVIIASDAGYDWQSVYQAAGATLLDVEFSASRFVAVGKGLDGRVVTSRFGDEWELVDVPWIGDGDSITGSNAGFYVAVGPEIWFSADGLVWEYDGAVPAAPAAIANGQRKGSGIDLFDLDRVDIAWTGTRLIWAGGPQLWARKDGGEWTLVTELGGCEPWSDWLGLAAGDGWAMASGISGCPTPYLNPTVSLTVSTDGGGSFRTPWQTELGGLPALARYGARWVAAGALGDVLVSTDGSTWDCDSGSCTSLACADELTSLAYDGSRWVAVGGVGLCDGFFERTSGATVAISTDAVSWQVHPLDGARFRGVTATEDGFLAVGEGWIARSEDGLSWSTEASPDGAYLLSVASGEGWTVMVGRNGALYISEDGHSWLKPYLFVTDDFNRVVYDGGSFVALGDAGTVLRSPDGMNWDTGFASTNVDLWGAAAGPDGWVAVGDDGVILADADGTTWLDRRSGVTAALRDVIWADGLFVVVGWEDRPDGAKPSVVLASSDGRHWTRFDVPGEQLRRISRTDGGWVAIGGERSILRTGCLGTLIQPEEEHLQLEVGTSHRLSVRVSPAVSAETVLRVRSSHPGRAAVAAEHVIPAGGDRVDVRVDGLALVADAVLTLSLPESAGGGSTSLLVTVQPPQWTPRRATGRVSP